MTRFKSPNGHPNAPRDPRSATCDLSLDRAADAPPVEPEWHRRDEVAADPAQPPLLHLLSTSDIEALFGRSARTIRRWVRAGHLGVVRVGGARFFREDDVRKLISEQLVNDILTPATRGRAPVTAFGSPTKGVDHD